MNNELNKWITRTDSKPDEDDWFMFDIYAGIQDHTQTRVRLTEQGWERLHPSFTLLCFVPKPEPPPLPTKSEQAKTDVDEKAVRIKYQDIVYAICNIVDRAYNRSVTKGEGTTIKHVCQDVENLVASRDNAHERFDGYQDQIEQLENKAAQLQHKQPAPTPNIKQLVTDFKAMLKEDLQGMGSFYWDGSIEPFFQQLKQLEPKDKGGDEKCDSVKPTLAKMEEKESSPAPEVTKGADSIEKMMEGLIAVGAEKQGIKHQVQAYPLPPGTAEKNAKFIDAGDLAGSIANQQEQPVNKTNPFVGLEPMEVTKEQPTQREVSDVELQVIVDELGAKYRKSEEPSFSRFIVRHYLSQQKEQQ